MQQLKLNSRHDKNSRRLRKNKIIPGILYGKEFGNMMFEIGEMQLTKDLSISGEHGIVSFDLNGHNGTAVIKEVQKDAVNQQVMHIDLEEISRDKDITVEVPIVFNGKDFLNEKGVVLQAEKDTVKISCKPDQVPKNVEFNIKNAKIGSVYKISDLEVADEISIAEDLDGVLASISGKQFIFEAEKDIQKN